LGFVQVGTETCQASNRANSVANVERTGNDVELNAERTKSTWPFVATAAKPFMTSGAVLLAIGLA
jgi:hypothetical protein